MTIFISLKGAKDIVKLKLRNLHFSLPTETFTQYHLPLRVDFLHESCILTVTFRLRIFYVIDAQHGVYISLNLLVDRFHKLVRCLCDWL